MNPEEMQKCWKMATGRSNAFSVDIIFYNDTALEWNIEKKPWKDNKL